MPPTEQPGSGSPAAATSTPRGRLRASDAEREATVAVLHRALGEGRLDLAETEERVAATYAARFRHELPALLEDLPQTRVIGPGAPSWSELWTALVWRVRILLTGDGTQLCPTVRQRRSAALIAALALVWVVVFALAGAAFAGA